jgi:hypothetical protein
MSAASWAQRWVAVLAQLETAVTEGERLVEQGRVEEFRVLPVPVVGGALPPELADRARHLQVRMTALTSRVVEAIASARRQVELAATERVDRAERAESPVRRQWQPAYVDARA